MANGTQPVTEARAVARHVHLGAPKARIVLDLVRGKPVAEALSLLRFVPKRAAGIVAKAIKSAAANASNNFEMDPDSLYVAQAYADEGPRMKRIQPRARGQAYPILKRTCHVTIVVREREEG